MFAGKGNSQRELDVILWSDGQVDPFFDHDFIDRDSFIEYKLNKNPDLTYSIEIMTIGEYKNRFQ